MSSPRVSPTPTASFGAPNTPTAQEIAAAAEKRQREAEPVQRESAELKAFKLALLKIIDEQILEKLGPVRRQTALNALDLLTTVCRNALDDPNKRSISLRSKALDKLQAPELFVVETGGFIGYLHEAGFRHEVKNFTARRTFPAQPTAEQLSRLRIALETLQQRKLSSSESRAWTERMQEREKEEEAAREAKAYVPANRTRLDAHSKRLLEEDRENVAIRVAREKRARDARAAVEAEDARMGAPPSYTPK